LNIRTSPGRVPSRKLNGKDGREPDYIYVSTGRSEPSEVLTLSLNSCLYLTKPIVKFMTARVMIATTDIVIGPYRLLLDSGGADATVTLTASIVLQI
jgi:hypothetical protein